MTLVLDNRAELKGKPGLHAFLAGVSHYRHLLDGSGAPATNTYGLNQLTAAATSASQFYEWLKSRSEHLAAPLATVRLLLSPAGNEITDPTVAPCTWSNFVEEANRWRNDASVSDDDVTLFYFAGHGIIRDKADSVLLCDDFAQPFHGPLPNVVAFLNMFAGMAPPADTTLRRARRQFYFIDACKEFPEQLKELEKIEIAPVFESELSGRDDRVAPVFNAAISGSEAYAITGKQTLFSIALLDCLNGLAGEATPENDDGTIDWHVTTFSLTKGLAFRMAELNERYGTNQRCQLAGIPGESPIHYLDGPPEVEGILKVIPEDAKGLINIEVRNLKQTTVWQPSSETVYPYRRILTAGSYLVKSTIREPPKPPYVDRTSDPKPVMPPNFVLRARTLP